MAIGNAAALPSASHDSGAWAHADHDTGTLWTRGAPQTTSTWVAFDHLIVPRALSEIMLRCTGVGSDYPRS